MTHRHLLISGGALTALNLVLLAMSWSIQAKADVAGMSRRDLYRDRDFRWAVEDVVTSCKIDDNKIKC